MEILNATVAFFNHPFFILIGGLAVSLSILGVLYKVVCWLFGITPVVFRLGIALWERRVAVFGSTESFENLKASLTDSKIFKSRNIIHIPSNNIDKAREGTIFLVDWETFGQQIEQVFAARHNHQTAVVIYAKPASIPPATMTDIANRSNTVVVNFRGRLLNDVLTSLVTTSYDRER